MTAEEAIKQISEIIYKVNINNIPLMDKPSELELKYLCTEIKYGCYIHTLKELKDKDITHWNYYRHYPKGVEEKIQDDKMYKVWFSDTPDGFGKIVKYIEEVNTNKILLKKYFESTINEKL